MNFYELIFKNNEFTLNKKITLRVSQLEGLITFKNFTSHDNTKNKDKILMSTSKNTISIFT